MKNQLLVLACVAGMLPLTGTAAENIESALRTNGVETLNAFEPVREVLQTSSAVISKDRLQLAYGMVVSADGLILTKASEIDGKTGLSMRIGEESYDSVEVLAVDPAWDVALLKVKAEGLVPVRWAKTSTIGQGTWVVANGATSRQRRRAMVGIISANPREISGAPAVVLGVSLGTEENDLRIEEVAKEGGAAEAGLKKGDVLVTFGEVKLENREQLLELLKTRSPGERVEFTYKRNGKVQKGEIVLAARDAVVAEPMSRNDQMSGMISKRRSSFKRVIQHDIPGNTESVGGPLLNLDGECLGMNIARANRVESFAIPLEEIQEIIQRLGAPKQP
jgi:S1-C subfamily serine protease